VERLTQVRRLYGRWHKFHGRRIYGEGNKGAPVVGVDQRRYAANHERQQQATDRGTND